MKGNTSLEVYEKNRAIGARIRDFRVSKGVSRNMLHNDTDMTPQILSAIENGHRKANPEQLATFAEYFGVTVEVMLGAEVDELERERAELVKIFDLCSRQGREAIMRTARFWEKTPDVSALSAQMKKEEYG